MDTVINELEDEMVANLNEYLDHIKADYRRWFKGRDDEIAQKMIKDFEAGISAEVGSKYIKIVTGSSVHSFVCYRDLGKFTKGDILKAASWRSPAKNFARGNLMSKDFSRVTWTGAQ
jgi:hypothetical protein